MEDRISINIYNVNKNGIVKIGILVFLKCELKLSKGFTVFLAMGAILNKVVNNLLIDIIMAKAF